VPAQDVPR